jgi:phosphatidylethanolamine/phosphatidyl-N-methylethanolamine N-methyltransferase
MIMAGFGDGSSCEGITRRSRQGHVTEGVCALGSRVRSGLWRLIQSRAAGGDRRAAEQIGGRILEVGVGTGISLPVYSSQNRITGIDLSEAMLRKARRRVAELSLTNVVKLEVMDAEHLSFPDASFDVVVANHVISTVPNPEAALGECARMLRPGGEMILLSRIGADAGLRHLIELMLQPVVRRLGWRSEFPWDRFARWSERRTDVRLIERRPTPPFGHFSLLRFVKCEQGSGI